MSQYMKVFNTCRIPGLKKDSLAQNPDSKHIIIVHNNHVQLKKCLNYYYRLIL